MDPLNGVADIENRELRLVSNYGFIEDPIRMIRAVRLGARLGWQMDEKTQARYATGKDEGYISAASPFQRGYETEEIVREEDPLRVMRRLEAEGWMAVLTPNWNSSKVNMAELERLRECQTQLQMQGIHPNTAAANFPLLTARLTAKEAADLKASFARPGFVREIEALDAEAKEFAAQFSAKSAALPSQSWKLLYSAKPEAVLMVALSSKNPAIQAKFKSFYSEWPLARQKVPYSLLQEMRITPELPDYEALIESLTYELIDGKLGTVEEMKAFLEPFSPPAPPPPVHLRRARTAKKQARAGKGRSKKSAPDAENEISAETGSETRDEGAAVAPSIEESLTQIPAPSAKTAAAEIAPVKAEATNPEPFTADATEAEPVSAGAMKAPAKKVLPASTKAEAPVKSALAAKSAAVKKAPITNTAIKTAAAKRPPAKAAKKPPAKAVAKKAAVKRPAAKLPVKGAAKKGAAKAPVKAAAKKAAVKAPIKAAATKVVAKAPARKRR